MDQQPPHFAHHPAHSNIWLVNARTADGPTQRSTNELFGQAGGMRAYDAGGGQDPCSGRAVHCELWKHCQCP